MKNILLVCITCVLAFASCKKEKITPTPTPTAPVVENLIALGSDTTSNNEVVTLFAQTSSLQTGYNKLYVSVKSLSGTSINDATVSFAPLMNMGSMTHACPSEQPVFNSEINKYEGVVAFTMPSTSGTWTLGVNVNGNSVTFGLNVIAAATKLVGSYSGTDGSVYYLTLVPTAAWTVGMNDVEIMIHKKASMMSFPADNDFTMVLDPEMISMGHGSPNNVSPTSIGNGHYRGKVNLTMTGDWRFNFELSKNGTVIIANAYVDILF